MSIVYIRNTGYGFGADTEGKYISLNLYLAGCSKEPKCKECHNPSLWDRDIDDAVEIDRVKKYIEIASELVGALVFLGGEPLDQKSAVLKIAKIAKECGLIVYLYTGKELEEKEISRLIRNDIDVIISGPYVPELANPRGSIPASSNQIITRK